MTVEHGGSASNWYMYCEKCQEPIPGRQWTEHAWLHMPSALTEDRIRQIIREEIARSKE